MRRRIPGVFHVLLVAAILGLLAWQASRLDAEIWELFATGHLRWRWLAGGLAVYLTAVTLTFLRWRMLSRALGIALSFGEASALGFLGYLMQFFSLGTLGGDVFKAVAVSRRPDAPLAIAVAAILVDRMVGLFSLVLFGVVVFYVCGQQQGLVRELRPFAAACAAAAVAGIVLLFLVLYTPIRLSDRLIGVPRLRPLMPAVLRFDAGISQYRTHRAAVWNAVGLGIVSHALQAASLFLAARSITDLTPSLMEQMAIWPIAGGAGAIPLTPAGLGTFDAAYTFLYNLHASQQGNAEIGLLISMLYRLMCLTTAAIGACYYLSRRDQWRAVAESSLTELDS